MYTFKKEERLCSEKLLEKLYHNGSSFLLYPFRVVWLIEPLPVAAQVVISVPKRRFKKAVDRNLLRRRIREAYRLHKTENLYSFLAEQDKQVLLGLSFVGKEIVEYPLIEKKLKAVFEQLKKLCHEYPDQNS